MDVRCDRCETEYELDDGIVTDSGAAVQCTTCGHTFVVKRRSTAPHGQIGAGAAPPTAANSAATQPSVTPPTAANDGGGPNVPEWSLSTDDGKVHRFRDLNTLQKWIVERKVTRTDRISRLGGPWLALGDVVELAPFFNVVDEADRARAVIGTPPSTRPPPGMIPPSASRGAGPTRTSPSPSNPIASTVSAPPAQPLDSRRVSEDGPTVPNRRLTETMLEQPSASSAVPPTPAPSRPSEPRPGIRPPDDRTPTRSVHVAGARAGAASPRPELFTPNVTSEAGLLDSDLLETSHTGRNVVVAVVLLLAAGAGGAWWWTQQGAATSHGAVPSRADSAKAGPAAAVGRTAVTTGRPAGDKAESKPDSKSRAAAEPKSADSREAPANVKADPRAESSTDTKSETKSDTDKVANGQARDLGAAGDGKLAAAGGAAAIASARGRASTGGGPTKGSRATAEAGGPVRAGSYEQLVREADRLLESGKSAKADKLYAQALAARPDGVAAMTGSAYVLLDRQRHFKAIETFRRALTVQPAYGPALFGIAESYRARGDTALALGAYRQYLAVAPSGTDAPAARRQIKELEAATPAPSVERPSPPPVSDP